MEPKILQWISIAIIFAGLTLMYTSSEIKGFGNFDPSFEDHEKFMKKAFKNKRNARYGYFLSILGLVVQVISIILQK
jgi:drug/metabolite transporter (DMT)-like permease